MEPIIKFNNGQGAILCNSCKAIIKDGLTKEEFEGDTSVLFCNKCAQLESFKIMSGPEKDAIFKNLFQSVQCLFDPQNPRFPHTIQDAIDRMTEMGETAELVGGGHCICPACKADLYACWSDDEVQQLQVWADKIAGEEVNTLKEIANKLVGMVEHVAQHNAMCGDTSSELELIKKALE